MTEKLALGLYTVYEVLNRSLEDTLKAVGAMGYDGVEFYGEPIWEPTRVRKALWDSGLELCGWHTEWRHLQADTIEKTIAYHREAGTPNLIVPALGGPWEIAHTLKQDCAGIWVSHAKALNHLAELVQPHGMKIGYHTHAHEFSQNYGGITPWDILCRDTGPEVILELDTGNCLEGGTDPTVALKALQHTAKRRGLLHFKPYSRERQFEVLLGDRDDLNQWATILSEGRKLNTTWFVIENEAENLGGKLKVAEACLERLRRIMNDETPC